MKEFFGDPYSMQVYGIVFGYLSIARLTVSYQRYWEVRPLDLLLPARD